MPAPAGENCSNVVVADQALNPDITSVADNFFENPGANAIHAVTEAYEGGLASKASGVSAQPGKITATGITGDDYRKAHFAATKPSGDPQVAWVDSKGNILRGPIGADHISVYVQKGNEAVEINQVPIPKK